MFACGLDDRPRPAPDEPAVRALLPARTDLALVATGDRQQRVGAAWWHFHEPLLVLGEEGQPLPEIAMAVAEGARGRGIGSRLLQGLIDAAGTWLVRRGHDPLVARRGVTRCAGRGRRGSRKLRRFRPEAP